MPSGCVLPYHSVLIIHFSFHGHGQDFHTAHSDVKFMLKVHGLVAVNKDPKIKTSLGIRSWLKYSIKNSMNLFSNG